MVAVRPTVSVVIPTYNRRDRWPALLRALEQQTFDADAFEVVVVSDGSTDGTDELLRRAATSFDLVVESQENAGPAAARNRAVELARGALVVFTDDDMVPTPGFIGQHMSTHERHGDDVAVIGPMLTPPDAALSAPVRWEQAMLDKQYDAMRRGDYPACYRQFFTGNASVRRSWLVDVGGFDTRLRRAEDIELAYRLHDAGCRFVFDPDAVGYHYAERPFASWLRNARDYGANDVIMASTRSLDALLDLTRREFACRNRWLRAITRRCVAHPRREAAVQRVLETTVGVTEAARARRLAHYALSGAFNIAYYCGMADELGRHRSISRSVPAAVTDGHG